MPSSCATVAPFRREWHDRLLAMLPAIQSQAQRAFRRMNACDQEEAVQAVVALATVAYARLVQRRQADRAYAAPLARFAVKQVRAGRLAGGKENCRNVGSQSCRRRGCVVESLGQWQAALCDSRRANPADKLPAQDFYECQSPKLTRARCDLGDGRERHPVLRNLWSNGPSNQGRQIARFKNAEK